MDVKSYWSASTRIRLFLSGVWLPVAAAASLQAETVMVQPTSVLAHPPLFGTYQASNARSQTGLMPGFTSGVTNYATYIAQNPVQDAMGSIVSTFVMTADGSATGDWDFDLGATYAVEHLLFWNTHSGVVNRVKDFEILVADNPSFNGASSAGTFTSAPPSNVYPTKLETFDLTSVTGRYVRLRVTSNAGGMRMMFGEVAFGVSPVDTAAPTVVSVERQTPSGQVVGAATTSVVFRVTYSEAVTNVTTASFAVEGINGGSASGSVTDVSGAGAARDVTVSITSGSGEFRLRVVN